MGRGGLDKNEMPLFQEFRQAFENSLSAEMCEEITKREF